MGAAELLPDFALLAIAMLGIAVGWTAGKLTTALFTPIIWILDKIPGGGGVTAELLSLTHNHIVSWCGTIYNGSDKLLGWSFHQLAKNADWMWDQWTGGWITDLAGAHVAVAHKVAINRLGTRTHKLATASSVRSSKVKNLETKYEGIDKRVKEIEKDISQGIGHDLRIHIKALDKKIAAINNTTIPAIRTRAKADEGKFAGLESWLGIRAGISSRTWAIAFATTLLTAVGLGGLRCSNFTNLLRKFGCGLGSLLDALLGVVISALVLENVCTLLPVLETAFGAVVGPVTHLLTEVPLGGCETPPAGWAKLSVAAGPLPPPQTLGSFPV